MLPILPFSVGLLATTATAFQLPFNVNMPFLAPSRSGSLKVAIIGAGAGGSSAAFWLSKAQARLDKNVTIDIYEKNGYIGGRSTVVYPYNDTELEAIELGASIFVGANKNLMRASEEFNLSLVGFGDEKQEMGIWDGSQFVLRLSDSNSWFDTAKLLWRYGYFAPTRTRTLVKQMVSHFLDLYSDSAPSWTSIASMSDSSGFTAFHTTNALELLAEQGIKGRFPNELIDAASRVNYGQSIGDIHALGALVSMAAENASSVKGGNFQIFEHFIKESGAKLQLDTEIASITGKNSKWQLRTLGGVTETYDAVIVTGPLHLSQMSLPTGVSTPEVPYVHLHVTLLVTTSPQPLPDYFFGAQPGATVPQTILTTSAGGNANDFNSLTYHGITRGGHIVKIFSMTTMDDKFLELLFGPDSIRWVYRHEFDAYPYLLPIKEFPPVILADNLYYVNAMEPFISTMETETVASRNVVELLIADQWGAQDRVCESGAMRGWDC